LVRAGADIVVGAGAHVLQGGGYLGGAYVDYGLGNFAFYDSDPPESDSGSLLITAVGRKITTAVFRPATDVNGLPQPLSGTGAQTALSSWAAARGCTGLAAVPSASRATEAGETSPFVTPTPTTAPSTASSTTPTTTPKSTGSASTSTTTSTTAAATTTAPTDNAG
jgi:hypothetical protein